MDDTKIGIITDTLSLREDLNSSWELLQIESEPVKEAILRRFKDTEERIENTTDIHALEKLHAFKLFLKAIAQQSDAKDLFITRMVKNFNSLDDAYWSGVINGQNILNEKELLERELESLSLRFLIVERALRKAIQKPRQVQKLTINRAAAA